MPLRIGFLYLVAVLDWYSRDVISWRLSNNLDGDFCVVALEEALAWSRPEIFNTDQGVQFTSQAFTGRLESAAVAISMDGRGRALDNDVPPGLSTPGSPEAHANGGPKYRPLFATPPRLQYLAGLG